MIHHDLLSKNVYLKSDILRKKLQQIDILKAEPVMRTCRVLFTTTKM